MRISTFASAQVLKNLTQLAHESASIGRLVYVLCTIVYVCVRLCTFAANAWRMQCFGFTFALFLRYFALFCVIFALFLRYFCVIFALFLRYLCVTFA